MGVLAYNLLHMIRQFYVWGEEVKRSPDWLSKRLIKVGAGVSYHARQRISCENITVGEILLGHRDSQDRFGTGAAKSAA